MAKQPNAWLTLVLKTMSVEELKAEMNNNATDDERRWMLEELKRRGYADTDISAQGA